MPVISVRRRRCSASVLSTSSAAGARGLCGGVDVAGLGPEQGARAVQRGRGFFGRQTQIGGLAAQRLGDRVDAMLGRRVGEGQLGEAAGQQVGVLLERLAAHHEGDQQPQQDERRHDAGDHRAQLMRQHACKRIRADEFEDVPGDTDQPQNGDGCGGETERSPAAEISHAILPHDPPTRISPIPAGRIIQSMLGGFSLASDQAKDLRSRLWYVCAGAEDRRHPGIFQELVILRPG